MLLSDFLDKPIVVSGCVRGVCRGVGISLKNYAVKYLLCASSPVRDVDFCVNFSAVEQRNEAVFLQRLRPVFPKNCAQITRLLPVFSHDGSSHGKLLDMELQNQIAVRFFTDKNKTFPVSAITACSDAILLKKPQTYPLGQPLPSKTIPFLSDKSATIVTKNVLRECMEGKNLVKMTLALPPFSLDFFSGEPV